MSRETSSSQCSWVFQNQELPRAVRTLSGDAIQFHMIGLPRQAGSMLLRYIVSHTDRETLLSGIKQQYPNASAEMALRAYAEAVIWQRGPVPLRGTQSIREYWKIYPDAKPETKQMNVIEMRFGPATLTMFPDVRQVFPLFSESMRRKLNEKFLYSPAALLSYSFAALRYQRMLSRNAVVSGMIYHPLIAGVTQAYRTKLETHVWAATGRVWHESSAALLRLTKEEMAFNQQFASVLDAIRMATPLEGRTPGLGGR